MIGRLAGLLIALLVMAGMSARAQDVAHPADGEYLRGHFVQHRYLKGFAAPLTSEGHFVLVPQRGLLWIAETPFAITTVISPAGLVQEVRGTETMRLPASRLPAVGKLYAMLGGALSGDWHALDDGFVVERQTGDKSWQLHLTPRRADDPALPFRQIVIRGERFADTVEIIKADGDRDVLDFHEQTLSAAPMSADEQQKFALMTRP